ncbi:MAG: hypothetical protein A2X34_00340 [Elusimicrobia bacterium GWC2_51_8]|nr:MAG: hypothetical protein A2X33_10795 [Elusimicrobia bacterium GWA2_51_34]OGR62326.1 MAG: hypothetical protein A2X34_00340 [Elusimicrobia bacterium GWC2_51_8]OGR85836.1 MAG: hypothetical protein A2021_05715 [Elusimicrobia bacterium GWF2_52_66]HAF94696.1 hypothetical protein [Elusimicrobiota bacterium]HCE98434.1 hypothetical protein [Elusimicrobiota bacterium]
MEKPKVCPICRKKAARNRDTIKFDGVRIICEQCGEYTITKQSLWNLENNPASEFLRTEALEQIQGGSTVEV